MLRGIQKATANWLGRVVTGLILGLIAVSFAIWGIGDIFRGFGQSTVAKVGDSEIGVEQFRQLYNDRIQQLSRQVQRPILPEQARMLGLDRQLLAQVIAENALDQNVRALGLNLADSEIAKRITTDPNFRGLSGEFDRSRFEFLIRQNGFTEGRYVNEQRKLSLRRQIVETISANFTPPSAMLELQHQYENEERKAEYLKLGPEQAGTIETPSPEILAAYFEQRKGSFRGPETRKVELVVLSPAAMAPWIEISDAEVEKAYNDRKANFSTPERREVQQIVFPNIDEARAASERIKQGTPFSQIISDRKLNEADVNLGLVTRSQIVDPAVAKAAFELPANGVSEPIAGRFGNVLVHVGKIEPEKTRPLAEVAAEIKRDLATRKARDQVSEHYNKIEDERGAGVPLKQIAEKLNIPVKTIESIDRSGRNAEGAALGDLPQGVDLISAVFSTDVGAENDPLKDASGGYVWYEVVDIKPARDRSLDEVKDRVVERWREEEIAKRLKARSDELVTKLKSAKFEDVAKESGVTAQTVTGLKRGRAASGLPRNVVDEIFATAKDAVGSSEAERPTERFIFRVTEIGVPPRDPNSEQAKQVTEALRTAYANELLAQYVAQLENELGTSINEAALNQVVGGGTN